MRGAAKKAPTPRTAGASGRPPVTLNWSNKAIDDAAVKAQLRDDEMTVTQLVRALLRHRPQEPVHEVTVLGDRVVLLRSEARDEATH